MRRAQAERILDAVVNQLGRRMAEIGFDSMFSISAYKDARRELADRVEKGKEWGKHHGVKDVMKMWVAAPAHDLTKPSSYSIAIGGQAASDDELLDVLVDHLESQHRWLLVEAYEAYERFLKNLYAGLGYLDRELWRCSDFGEIPPGSITHQKIDWFRDRVGKGIGKHGIKDILSRLRSAFPQFKTFETKNSLRVDFSKHVRIIGLLRHIVVHGSSRCLFSTLESEFEKQTGLALKGKIKAALIGRYVLLDGEECVVTALDRQRLTPPYHFLNKPLTAAVEALSSHACLAYMQAISHFDLTPIWYRASRS